MEILGTVIDLIIQRSYPEGVEHLQALLEHSLNAINPNDSDKTQAAFKIYFSTNYFYIYLFIITQDSYQLFL